MLKQNKTIQLHSVGAVMLIYCCAALNCGEGCQQAETKQEGAEAVTEVAPRLKKGLT